MIIYQITGIGNPVITGFAGKSGDDAPALLAKLISNLIGLFLTIATIWAFVQLLLAGFNWISSGGDKGKIEMAQHKITNAILGLFIIFAAWGIFLLIMQFLGMSPLGGDTGKFELKIPTLF